MVQHLRHRDLTLLYLGMKRAAGSLERGGGAWKTIIKDFKQGLGRLAQSGEVVQMGKAEMSGNSKETSHCPANAEMWCLPPSPTHSPAGLHNMQALESNALPGNDGTDLLLYYGKKKQVKF